MNKYFKLYIPTLKSTVEKKISFKPVTFGNIFSHSGYGGWFHLHFFFTISENLKKYHSLTLTKLNAKIKYT